MDGPCLVPPECLLLFHQNVLQMFASKPFRVRVQAEPVLEAVSGAQVRRQVPTYGPRAKQFSGPCTRVPLTSGVPVDLSQSQSQSRRSATMRRAWEYGPLCPEHASSHVVAVSVSGVHCKEATDP